jgi:hypothetical protein
MIIEAGEQPKKRVTHGNPEAIIQASCVEWLWNEHPETRGYYFAVPNELSTSNRMSKQDQLREGAKRRAMGTLKGVSDTILLLPNAHYHAACIEYKTAVGYQSEAQKEFETRVKIKGYAYVVVRSLDEFKEFIENYLK